MPILRAQSLEDRVGVESPENIVKNLNPETEQPEQDSQAEANQAGAGELQKRIQELEAQLKEKESKYVYLYADFENYKKRMTKERSDLIKFGWESVARDLLGVVDNLERALTHAPQGVDKNWMQGIEMVLSQFKSALEKQGVQPVETVGQPFDPNFHEALGQEPSPLPEGTITQEHGRGYTLHGRLLRPARVVLSAGHSGTAGTAGTA